MLRESLFGGICAALVACSPSQRTSSETHFVSCSTDHECVAALGADHECNAGWCTPPRSVGATRDASTPRRVVDAASADEMKATSIFGDRVCGSGETPTSCPSDCMQAGSRCGDRVCGPGESAQNCPFDCRDTPDGAGTLPSCAGLEPTCGPNHDGDCCASLQVPGGTFDRSNQASFPATVSDFRLDKYEIAVGRFRAFIAAYSQDMIPNGAGKNPNDPSDRGWDVAWNAHLPRDSAALTASVECDGQVGSTFRGAITPEHESRPINCIDWYRAFAFCIWDGGRLPTEAEWNYAAAGGSEQRPLPWTTSLPVVTDAGPDVSPDATYAVYSCYFNGNGACTDVKNIAPVGSASAGNGKWGHSDLAGNVWEWTLDAFADPYPPGSCRDCANLVTTPSDGHVPGRAARGGHYGGPSRYLLTYWRLEVPSTWGQDDSMGARCARAP
jgi:formylglycine-generating enzyme required for sulfatase activity